MRLGPAIISGVLVTLLPEYAFAQRFPFERTWPVTSATALEVVTERGRIDVVAGATDAIVVEGEVTVRFGLDVPADAVDIARRVASAPPIEHTGALVRLGLPADEASRRAVTIHYTVRVPPLTRVNTRTNSGATTLKNLEGVVSVRTGSAAIAIHSLSGPTDLTTGSGAVLAEEISGSLTVSTRSGSITAHRLGSSLRVRTESGEVKGTFTGTGDLDVETGSSAMTVQGLRAGVTAMTRSGRVTLQGDPGGDWTVATGSSSIAVDLQPRGLAIDAATQSGSIVVEGDRVEGTSSKRAVKGMVAGGGPSLRLKTRSGSIRIRLGR